MNPRDLGLREPPADGFGAGLVPHAPGSAGSENRAQARLAESHAVPRFGTRGTSDLPLGDHRRHPDRKFDGSRDNRRDLGDDVRCPHDLLSYPCAQGRRLTPQGSGADQTGWLAPAGWGCVPAASAYQPGQRRREMTVLGYTVGYITIKAGITESDTRRSDGVETGRLELPTPALQSRSGVSTDVRGRPETSVDDVRGSVVVHRGPCSSAGSATRLATRTGIDGGVSDQRTLWVTSAILTLQS